MNTILDLFYREPALLIGFANAILLVLVNFGIPISADQKLSIDTLLGAALAILAGVTIRTQVSSVHTLALRAKALQAVQTSKPEKSILS